MVKRQVLTVNYTPGKVHAAASAEAQEYLCGVKVDVEKDHEVDYPVSCRRCLLKLTAPRRRKSK